MKSKFLVKKQKTWRFMLTSGMMVSTLSYTPVWSSDKTEDVKVVEQSTKTYEGLVIDANTEEPLIGATITLKGSTTGVVTDLDGRFSINAAPGQILSISFIGYASKEVKLSNLTLLNIDLSEDKQVLEEVVVTAFGVGQKKESMVGAVTQVRGGDLKIPSANLSNSFAGRVSGVTAFQNSGEPGNDGSTFYIRGISTLTATSPLIIIDGVEASQGDLNALDAEVIESFSVLKDATATAMYGTRGANGVMIVATKNGENLEKAVINARIEGYVAMPTKVPEFVDANRYMNMYNEAQSNYANTTFRYTDDKIAGTMAGLDPIHYPNVDWYDELFKGASFNQRANFNVRGGGNE